MFRSRARRGALAALLALAAVSCGRSKPVGMDPSDGGPADTGTAETGAEVAPTARGGCLDRPDTLQRPPTAGLPCDLIPPGLEL
jgi:hypothetical protein